MTSSDKEMFCSSGDGEVGEQGEDDIGYITATL
jgi:hypothetical protein